MSGHEIRIRPVRPDDAQQLLEIYAPYVTETAISFEYSVPSLREFTDRIKQILPRYPYLAAEIDGKLAGYAYTHPFVGRAAYDWSAETTIYIQKDARKMGAGRKLYEMLEQISRAQNITNLYACIGYPETEDEYLTRNSVEFHRHLGFRLVGEFHKCGYKFGRWYDMVWMEKVIREPDPDPNPVIPFSQLDWKF